MNTIWKYAIIVAVLLIIALVVIKITKKDFGIEVDKKKVLLSETIKVAGVTIVDIKLNEGVMTKLKVMVVVLQKY